MYPIKETIRAISLLDKCLPFSYIWSKLSTEDNEYKRYPVFVPTASDLKHINQ